MLEDTVPQRRPLGPRQLWLVRNLSAVAYAWTWIFVGALIVAIGARLRNYNLLATASMGALLALVLTLWITVRLSRRWRTIGIEQLRRTVGDRDP